MIAYFPQYSDARAHMLKHAAKYPDCRIVSYTRGFAVQARVSGPYLNRDGETA